MDQLEQRGFLGVMEPDHEGRAVHTVVVLNRKQLELPFRETVFALREIVLIEPRKRSNQEVDL